jgi:hypothetical protein
MIWNCFGCATVCGGIERETVARLGLIYSFQAFHQFQVCHELCVPVTHNPTQTVAR